MMNKGFVYLFVGFFLVMGLLLVASPSFLNIKDTIWDSILSNIGVGLIATCMISFFLDITWSRYRESYEREKIETIINDWKSFKKNLEEIESRLGAFEQLGLNSCHKNRESAMRQFLYYAKDKIGKSQNTDKCVEHMGTINVVSSSARGLLGYLDREPTETQSEWRDLIEKESKHFKFLLTHPAYAHLRQPAEERESGDIEVEIIKTALYLYGVCEMDSNNLRFYRGSPSVFQMQVGNYILLNPYPYGKMAMDTLSLEFEIKKYGSEKEYFVEEFAQKHFNHTWSFYQQPSKRVDSVQMVQGVDSLEDILKAFAECTYLGSKTSRLNESRVAELDRFTVIQLKDKFVPSRFPKTPTPFKNYLVNEQIEALKD
jgi:hypothetical protein